MTKPILTLLILVIGSHLFGQSLIKFDYSGCLRDCVNDSSKINEIERRGRLTTIGIKTYAPCNGNLDGGIELRNSFLDLTFYTKPAIITDKKGKKTELTEVSDCNCLFDFTYQIKDLPGVDKKEIRINGLTLKEIDRKNIFSEIEIN